MKVQTQFDESYQGSPGREMDPTSQTVPDMGISLQQLLINHTRGLPSPSMVREAHYFEDLEIPNIEDLVDLQDQRRFLSEREEALRASQSDDLKPDEPSISLKEDLPPEPSVAKE